MARGRVSVRVAVTNAVAIMATVTGMAQGSLQTIHFLFLPLSFGRCQLLLQNDTNQGSSRDKGLRGV